MLRDCVNIIESVDVNESLTIKSGGKLTNLGGSFTLGAWVNFAGGGYGLLTCGHAFFENGSYQPNYKNVYSGSTTAGEIVGIVATSSYAKFGGAYDCAVATRNSPLYYPTSEIVPGGTISAVGNGMVADGTLVYQYGAYSGLSMGYAEYHLSGADHTTHSIFVNYGTSKYGTGFGNVELGDSGGPFTLL